MFAKQQFLLAALFVVAVIILVVVAIMFKKILLLKRTNNSAGISCIALSILCILAATVSWIMNFGWIRFFLTIILAPVIHSIAFLVINISASPYVCLSKKLGIFTHISRLSYILSYFFLPDGGDAGPMYVFFGLIKSDNPILFSICGFMEIAFLLNIVCMVAQIILTSNVKKEIRAKSGK